MARRTVHREFSSSSLPLSPPRVHGEHRPKPHQCSSGRGPPLQSCPTLAEKSKGFSARFDSGLVANARAGEALIGIGRSRLTRDLLFGAPGFEPAWQSRQGRKIGFDRGCVDQTESGEYSAAA